MCKLLQSCATVECNYPSIPFNRSFAKLSFKLGHGWLITAHIRLWMWYFIRAEIAINILARLQKENCAYRISKLFKWKLLYHGSNFTEVYSLGSNCQYNSIGSDNGLAPNHRWACLLTQVWLTPGKRGLWSLNQGNKPFGDCCMFRYKRCCHQPINGYRLKLQLSCQTL